MEALEARQLMAAVAWDGGGDGLNWHDARNWSADVLPAAADDVTIGAEWLKVRVGIDAGAVEIRSLSTAARLEVPDGRLSATGTIRAERGVELGKVGNLEAGDRIEIFGQPGGTMRLDGRLRAASVRVDAGLSGYVLIGGSIDASSATGSGGSIVVLGERIALTGALLDASGRTGGGSIEVGGSRYGRGPLPNSVQLFTDAETSLRADAIQNGNGGQVVIYASNFTAFYGSASVRGGSVSGNGGFVETSGGVAFDVNPVGIDAAAPKGTSGLWVLDPTNVTIAAGGNDNLVFNTVTGGFAFVGTPLSAFLNSASLISALAAGTSVTIFTNNVGAGGTGNISVTAAINPVIAAGAPTLKLLAANNIVISAGISSTGAGSLDLVLAANNGRSSIDGPINDDPNTAAGDVTLNAAISLPNGGFFRALGVNFSQILAGSVSAAGGIDLGFSGNVSLGSNVMSSSGQIFIVGGNDGTGNITATLGISLSAPTISLRAGDGLGGGGDTATFSTTNMSFRGAAGGFTRPLFLTLRQDAAVTDSQIPTTAQFGASIAGMTYAVQSDASSIQATSPAKFTGSILTLNSGVAVTQLVGSYSLASLFASSPVSLQGTTTISTGSGGIFFGGSIGAPLGQSLTLNSTGATQVVGPVGTVNPLGGFTSDAGGTLSVASIATIGGGTFLLDSTVTLNGTYTTNNSNFTTNSASSGLTLLAGNVTVSAGAGQARFNGEVQSSGGPWSLTVTSALGLTFFSGSVGGVSGAADSQRIESLSVSGNVTFGDGGASNERFVRTASAGTAIDIVGNTTLSDNVTFDTGAGNPGAAASFNGTIGQGAVGAPFRNLTLRSQGTVNLFGSIGVGGNGSIGNIASDAGGTLNISGAVATNGTQAYADALVRVLNSTAFTTTGSVLTFGNTLLIGNPVFNSMTGSIVFNGTLDGAQNLNIDNVGSVTFVGVVGGTTPLASLLISPDPTLVIFQNSAMTVTGTISLNRQAIIQAAATSITTGGNFVANSAINGIVAGVNTLSLSVGGTAFFESVVGATALSNLNISGAGSAVFARNVTVVNNITATTAVRFDNITFSATSGSITFNGNVAGRISSPNNGVFTAGSTVTFGALLGSGTGFGVNNITVNALTTFLGGNVSYAGDMTISGAVVLNNAVTVSATAATSDLFVSGSVNSAAGGPRNLSLFVGGITRLSGGAGSTNALGAVSSTTPGTTQLSGAFFVDSWDIQESVVLIGNTTIEATDVVFIGGTVDGAFDLTVNNSSTTTFNTTVGGTTPLASLSTGFGGGLSLNTVTTAGNIIIGNAVLAMNNITATAPTAIINFVSAVTLGGSVVVTSGTAGSITFNGAVNGDAAGTRNLTLIGQQVVSINGPMGGTQRLLNFTAVTGNSSFFNSVSTQNAINIQSPDIALDGASYNSIAGTINFNGPVRVRGNTTVTAPTISFQSTLNSDPVLASGRSLTVGNGSSTTLFAGVIGGGTRPLGALNVNGLARFTNTNVTTSNAGGASGAQTYIGTVQLENGASTSNFTGTTVSFTNVVGLGGVSARGDLNVVGAVQLNGNIGSVGLPLRSVVLAGASISTNSTSAIFVSNANGGTGNVVFGTQALMNAPLTVNITGGTGTFASLEGPSTFTLNGAGTFNDNLGFFTPLGAVTMNGPVTLNVPEARVAGALTFNGAVTLVRATGTTLFSTGNVPINFASTVNAGGAGGGLTLNNTGSVIFASSVGAGVPLNSITSDAGGSISFAGTVRTIGAQTYNDANISIAEPLTTTNAPITFGGGVGLNFGPTQDLTISSGSGNISFGSTINGARRLVLNSSGLTSVAGAVGSLATPIVFVTDTAGTSSFRDLRVFGAISINDPTTLLGVVEGSTSSIFINGPITLAGNSSINNLSVASFTNLGLINGAFSLNITSASPLSLTASIGATTPLAALTVNSPFPFGGSTMTTTGNITLNGAMQLVNNTTITAGGVFTANAGIDSFDMQRSLTIAASGGANLQAVGNSTPVSALTFTSATSAVAVSSSISVGTLTQQAGSGVYQGAINTFAFGISLIGTSFTINGNSSTTNNGPFTLTNSGPSSISGSLSLDGTFTQSGAGVTLNGVTITTTNDTVNFGSVTLSVGASSINTGAGPGNITFGTINGAQNLTLTSGSGDIIFTGAVGGTTRIGSLSLISPTNVSAGAISATTITQNAGSGTYSGLLNTNAVGGINLTGTTFAINGGATTTTGGSLSVNTASGLTFGVGGVVTLDGPLSQTGLGTVALNGSTITTTNDAISFASDVRVASGNAVLSTGTGGITFAARLDGPGGITLNSSGTVVVIGQAGLITQLGSLVTDVAGSISLRDVRSGGNITLLDAAITLNGALTLTGGTANINVGGVAVLAGNTSVQTSAAGTVTFGNTLNADSAVNNRTLSIVGGTGSVQFLSSVGNSASLASITTTGSGPLALRSVTTTGNQSWGGSSTSLGGNVAATSGNVTFNSTVTLTTAAIMSASLTTLNGGANAGANTLTFRSADVAFNGNVAGTGALRIEPLAAGQGITLGSGGASPDIDLTSSTLARIQPGFSSVTFGRSDGSGVITVASPLTVNNPTTFLAPAAGGQFAINAPINAVGNGSVTFTGPGSTILLGASITTAGAPITFNDAVRVTTTGVIISTTGNGSAPIGAPIFFGFGITSEVGENNPLTIIASTTGSTGTITVTGRIGGGPLIDPGNLTLTTSPLATTTLLGIETSSIGTITFNTRLRAVTQNIIGAAGVVVNGPIDSVAAPAGLQISSGNGGTIAINGPVGQTNILSTLTVVGGLTSSTIILNAGAVSTQGTQLYAGSDLRLGSNTTLIAGEFIIFDSAINANNFSLNLQATFNVSLQAVTNLTTLTIAPAVGATFINGNITSSGDQTYGSAVQITATPIMLSSSAGTIRFNSALLCQANNLTITANEIDLGGLVTGSGALVLQPFSADQPVSVAGPEGGDLLDITQPELDFIEPGFSTVTIGRLDGTSSLDIGDATFDNDTNLFMAGPRGTVNARGQSRGTGNASITVRGSGSTTNITGSFVTSGGAINIFDAVNIIGTNVRIDTTNNGTTAGGAVLIDRVINSAPTLANSLRVDSGIGAVTLNGSVGTAPQGQLGSLIINGTGPANLNAPQIRTIGSQTYNNPVNLGVGVTLTNINAPITFGSSINGANNLTIAPGTGATVFNGPIGNAANPTNLTINSGNSRTFNSEVAVRTLTVFGGTVEFNGPASAQGGVFISGTFRGSSNVTFNGPLTWVGGTMTGTGRTIIGPDGTLVVSGGNKTLGRTIENLGVAFWTDGSINFAGGSIINRAAGSFFAQSDGAIIGVSGVNSFVNEGYLERSGSSNAVSFNNIQVTNTGMLAIVEGSVTITPNGGTFVNAGILDLRVGRSLNIVGNFTNDPAGTIRTQFAALAPGQAGQVVATGNVTLGGTLTGAQTGPITANTGDRVDVVVGANVSGTFSSVVLPGTGIDRRKLAATYLPDRAQILFTFSSDYNLDGELNQEDLGGFLTGFLQEPSDILADFNGDGFVDQEDLSGFITDYFTDAG